MHIMCYFYARDIRFLVASLVEMATISSRGLYELKGGDKSLLHRDRHQCSARVPIRGDRSGDLPLYYDNVCFCWRRHKLCYQPDSWNFQCKTVALERHGRKSSRSDVTFESKEKLFLEPNGVVLGVEILFPTLLA